MKKHVSLLPEHKHPHAHGSVRRGVRRSFPLSQSGCHVLSDGVSSPPADEPAEPLKAFQGPVAYVLGLPGSAIPLINAAWVPT